MRGLAGTLPALCGKEKIVQTGSRETILGPALWYCRKNHYVGHRHSSQALVHDLAAPLSIQLLERVKSSRPCHPCGRLSISSWPLPGPTLATVTIWGVNQWLEEFLSSPSTLFPSLLSLSFSPLLPLSLLPFLSPSACQVLLFNFT